MMCNNNGNNGDSSLCDSGAVIYRQEYGIKLLKTCVEAPKQRVGQGAGKGERQGAGQRERQGRGRGRQGRGQGAGQGPGQGPFLFLKRAHTWYGVNTLSTECL
jgi:hypothetical protein